MITLESAIYAQKGRFKYMTELLLKELQAAEKLILSPRTLAQWRFLGKGPAFIRISPRCIRYRSADVENWIAQHVQQTSGSNENE